VNANELADELENDINWIQDGLARKWVVDMLRQQQTEIEYWKEKFNKAMDMQEVKPAKYSDAWWKEVEEFNKRLKAQNK
jgi:hypothetical protein